LRYAVDELDRLSSQGLGESFDHSAAYLILGARKKLGRLRIEEIPQLGEAIESLAKPFETVPHLDKLRLRRSA